MESLLCIQDCLHNIGYSDINIYIKMDRQIVSQMDKLTDRLTDGLTDWPTDEQRDIQDTDIYKIYLR